ncbi:uncharacterized protein LOC105444773 [Strongylocentrotus purpuratus]|uniref:Uncharacterized protein n=1 Tax=Strongylocentrotus purpuratus TaxID=7668 RepID=A0A7M7LWD9_STRPU|nr:uncharacterized protein LOC105444773 [Strongylocentrotus purpuratus]
MAVENSGQQRRGMDRRNLKERIAMATCHLAAIDKETAKEEGRLLELVQEVGDARLESERSKQELHEEQNRYREFLLGCCKIAEDDKALDARSRAVESALQTLRRRKWKTDIMLKSATGEIKLLDHRIMKEQTLQKEQRDRRLGDKRRRVQRTSLKVNTLVVLIILQIILIVIIALWRL